MDEKNIDLSIITVSWNSAGHIARQLESAQKAAQNISIEQFVIDNGSTDDTAKIVREQFPSVTFIQNTENKGFGAANQQGIDLSKGKYLLFLNPDMHLTAGSLDMFVKWMDEHHDVGIASPKLLDAQGNLNLEATPRRLPKLWEQIALILKIPHVFPSIMNGYMMKGFAADIEQDVDSVRGSFMLVRRKLVDILGWAFDPRYFIWYEDVDICREAKKHGFRVVHTPIISATDFIGQSFKKRTSLWKQKAFTKSMLTYYKKWEPWYVWMWIALFRPIGVFLVWMEEKIFHRGKK